MNHPPGFEKQSGFTLIETLIYIAFFALLVGSLLSITFQTLASTDQINKKVVLQQEANFVLRKLNWALTGASAVSFPALGATGNTLTITNTTLGAGNSPVTFTATSSQVWLKLGVGASMPLTSQNVTVNNLQFGHSQLIGEPGKITATTTIDNTTFSLKKYLR